MSFVRLYRCEMSPVTTPLAAQNGNPFDQLTLLNTHLEALTHTRINLQGHTYLRSTSS